MQMLLVLLSSLGFLSHPAMAGEDLKFASNVRPEWVGLLRDDIATLKTLRLRDDEDLARLLDLPRMDALLVNDWLAERVTIIANEDFDQNAAWVSTGSPATYEFPGQTPEYVLPHHGEWIKVLQPLEPPTPPVRNRGGVASNVGVGQYLKGKSRGVLGALNIPGLGLIPLSSPRTGVVRIGPGLFALLDDQGYVDPVGKANRLMRLMGLLHEGRHSDGHGTHTSFGHTICPFGHDWAGRSACDKYLNGSYMVGAKVLRNFAASCDDCSVAEKEVLKLQALDSLNRVLKEGQKYNGVALAEYLCRAIEASTSRSG